jgi:hypothetical protein
MNRRQRRLAAVLMFKYTLSSIFKALANQQGRALVFADTPWFIPYWALPVRIRSGPAYQARSVACSTRRAPPATAASAGIPGAPGSATGLGCRTAGAPAPCWHSNSLIQQVVCQPDSPIWIRNYFSSHSKFLGFVSPGRLMRSAILAGAGFKALKRSTPFR